MRRALAFAALIGLAAAGSAAAETWTKYVDAANGTAWSIDTDYSYKDRQSGRVVVMQAISKPEAKIGPSAPGKADGVGSVAAIDCSKKNMILIASYTPSKPLEIPGNWRDSTPKKISGADNEALAAMACAQAGRLPLK
ncbi:MAG: hypothetical protein ABI655_14530 [Phenylobacterium sp.]